MAEDGMFIQEFKFLIHDGPAQFYYSSLNFSSPLLGVIPVLIYPFEIHLSPPLVQLGFFSWMFVPSRLWWRWVSMLQAVKTLFRSHFLINATNWVGAMHWMQRWWISSSRDLPSSLLAPLLLLFFGILSLVLGGLIEPSEQPCSSGFSDGSSPRT